MELHRPYVDNIHIKCEECGEVATRVSDVLDVWFDSGAMPYCQFHYPFENKELFERQFPADFIAEGVDQTRGWFYVLLVISTIISGKSSFKNVVVNDMVLDDKGKKMSKSVGNIVDPTIALTQYGADNVRWYMFYASPVWTPLKYDDNGVKEVYSKFFNPLKNTYSFFQTYANIDGINIDECKVSYDDREEIDKWIISKYNKLLREVKNAYEKYDLNIATRAITSFVSDDLSNWYIRRNRNRFWSSSLDNSKKSVYITTYEVLEGLCRMCAPIIPFVTEEIYTKLTGNESVHLADFPIYNEELINEEIETKMDLVRDLISSGRFVREEAKIKVRQPISECLIDGKYKDILGDLVNLIIEELNVKNVVFTNELSKYMNFNVKPNFKVCGKMFGSHIREYQELLNGLNLDNINNLMNNEVIKVMFNNDDLIINPDMVDIRIESKEGFNVGMINNRFIILNTTLTKDLINEGIARETISKVQQMRKNNGYDIADRINIYYSSNDDYSDAINDYIEFIKNETLALNINKVEDVEFNTDINDMQVGFKLEITK